MATAINDAWEHKDFERFKEEGYYIINTDNTDMSFLIRINKCMALIDGTLKYPIFGLGLSVTKEACDENYVRIFAESGILGIITWMSVIITVYKSTKQNKDEFNTLVKYGVIILLLEAIFIDIFEASKIMMFYWFVVGCAYASNDKKQCNEEDKENKILSDKCSIVMATYNGEKYLREQIETILSNMRDYDELVISDDGSKDNTIKIIEEISSKDKRIKIIEGPRKGVKQNFSNAINTASGKYIILADQDDIWKENKIKTILDTFKENENCTLVVHDAEVFNSESNTIIYPSFFEYRKSGAGVIKNIYKNTYIGCCMAFDEKIKSKILPIPDNIEMHDQWIGIINDKLFTKSIFINDKLIKYRRHENNVSQMNHYTISKMIKNRIILVKEIIKRNK